MFRYLIALRRLLPALAFATVVVSQQAVSQEPRLFTAADVWELERAVDPQVSPDGRTVVYVRTGVDVMTEKGVTSLWTVGVDGSNHRQLSSVDGSYSQPRWSPDGSMLAYVSARDGKPQIYVRWMDTGQEAQLTNLTRGPGGITWSPDGNWIAFSMFVPHDDGTLRADMPDRPEGAEWGPPITVIDQLTYRADGRGYLEEGKNQLFVIPVEGGTPRQLTDGPYNHGGRLAWSPDASTLYFSANRHENPDSVPLNSEIYAVSLADGSITQLTDRFGPDANPVVSPDGRRIAYTGLDDHYQGYQVTKLYVMNADGSDPQLITGSLDRGVQNPNWSNNGRHIYFQYDSEGHTFVARTTLDGDLETVATEVGGLSLGRPYSGGQYSMSPQGVVAFTRGTPQRPADLAVVTRAGRDAVQLTHLNDDLLGQRDLGEVEEFWYESSFDGRRVQGWILTPPGFDSSRRYPLILEIHGGPFANYGFRFSAEDQLYAAAGYVVLYTNPRGGTGYGAEFGNLIHHHYPGEDYDDLMSGVDAVVARGFIDEDRMYVTGGSGGGVLSAWIVGKTDRFRAAAVQKPVINWYSFVLNADNPNFFWRYWFPGPPWENQDHYMARSPISLVGNVTTPTMLVTGEQDHRTPISETEQFYGALKIRGIEATMVRIPDASHGIASRASNMIAKVQYILEWFRTHSTGPTT